MYKDRVPKCTGAVTHVFKDDSLKVVQGLDSVDNRKVTQAFRGSGHDGVLTKTYRERDPYQIVLLPLGHDIALARKVALQCGHDAFGVVMTRRGYAIRATEESKPRVEAVVNADIAESLGDSFVLLHASNPDARLFVVRGIPARMTQVQIIQAMLDAIGWATL